MATLINGLYAITPERTDSNRLLREVEAALRGGASVLQYRAKHLAPNLKANQAQAVQGLCKKYRVPLIINDDAALAASMSASGVHIGSQDMPFEEAQQSLLSGMLVGVSCYDQLAFAMEAETNGADYVAFGSFFPSPTKPNAVRASLDLLREAKQQLSCPIVAIGGITLENAAPLIEAGADAVAVIGALFEAPDIEATAKEFTQLFKHR
ncbi:MAG: thiamine phosphate synthase [Burkholderiales bacterium]|nr:thiamine phosphate synthase [Pseudomonadota bacterium]